MVRCNRCESPFPTNMTACECSRSMSLNMGALRASMKSRPSTRGKVPRLIIFPARCELIKEGIHFEGDPFSLKATNAPSILFLIGPKTGHDMHPESRKVLNAYLYDRIKMGRQIPDHIRFVTYTARYNRDYWVTLDGLEKHYERAEVDARRSENRSQYEITTRNLTRLVLRQTDRATSITIDGQKLRVKSAPEMAFEKSNQH